MMPHPSLDSFYFWNSGSEAIEGAIKMARIITGKQNIISMQGTHLLSATSCFHHLMNRILRRISWPHLWSNGCYEEQDDLQ